jgi:hypothetical protein
MAMLRQRRRTAIGERSGLRRAALRGLPLSCLVGLSLLAAACGGGSPGAKVAQIGTTTSANGSQSSSSASSSGDPTGYSACMRSHGVPNFPDADKNGHFPNTPGVDPYSPQFSNAEQACTKFNPRPTAAQETDDPEAFLKYARCMRSHGVPKFPDPKPGSGLKIAGTGINPNTPQFKTAQQACRKVVPGILAIASPPAAGGGPG